MDPSLNPTSASTGCSISKGTDKISCFSGLAESVEVNSSGQTIRRRERQVMSQVPLSILTHYILLTIEAEVCAENTFATWAQVNRKKKQFWQPRIHAWSISHVTSKMAAIEKG